VTVELQRIEEAVSASVKSLLKLSLCLSQI